MQIIDRFDGTEYRFLSNFYPAPVNLDGETYPSSENAYQAAKSLNDDERRAFRGNVSAALSKKMGKKLKLRPDWEEVKRDIMKKIVLNKFTYHPSLKEKLLATGDAELIEGNTWGDTFFGVCNGVGQNQLGKILMEVREELRNEKAKKVKIDGEWWKYFVDHGAKDEKDEAAYAKIILYAPDGKQYFLRTAQKRVYRAAEVKQLWKNGAFAQ